MFYIQLINRLWYLVFFFFLPNTLLLILNFGVLYEQVYMLTLFFKVASYLYFLPARRNLIFLVIF